MKRINTAAAGLVSLRINARYPSIEQATEELNKTVDQCHAALGDLIFGADADTLVSTVHTLLTNKVGVATSVATSAISLVPRIGNGL